MLADAGIVYCPTHRAAFVLAEFLFTEIMPRYVELFEAAGLGTFAARDSVVVEQANVLAAAIGR